MGETQARSLTPSYSLAHSHNIPDTWNPVLSTRHSHHTKGHAGRSRKSFLFHCIKASDQFQSIHFSLIINQDIPALWFYRRHVTLGPQIPEINARKQHENSSWRQYGESRDKADEISILILLISKFLVCLQSLVLGTQEWLIQKGRLSMVSNMVFCVESIGNQKARSCLCGEPNFELHSFSQVSGRWKRKRSGKWTINKTRTVR